jgi:glycine/D-amino acid oxidase-like deaminating enzyme
MPKPALRSGTTVWLETPNAPPTYPALRGHHETEVAIIGAGMTGAMIAQAFAEHGTTVTVVDAERAGHGSTAASTALLLQEPDYDLEALGRKYGSAVGRRLWQLSRAAARDFVARVRRLKIECDLDERDSLYYTLADDRARLLQRELKARRGAGLRGEWADGTALRHATGIYGAGAIRTSGNAQLNPLRACLGFLGAAEHDGAAIFERTNIHRIRKIAGGVRLYSPGGTIDARQVVIATGYATQYFRPLAGRFRMRHTYVMMTNRFTAQQRRRIGLGNVLLWDTERPYHYVRWTGDRRLLLGGADRPVKPGARRSLQFTAAMRDLQNYFYGLYPILAEVGIDQAWDGLFAMTPDGFPYLGPHLRYPRHAFALGYGGNGMTFAALAARILLEQWRGVTSPDHQLFAFGRKPRRTR